MEFLGEEGLYCGGVHIGRFEPCWLVTCPVPLLMVSVERLQVERMTSGGCSIFSPAARGGGRCIPSENGGLPGRNTSYSRSRERFSWAHLSSICHTALCVPSVER